MEEMTLAALDLGSTRFRAVVAEPDGKGGVAILGHASLPARGVSRGQLNDLPQAAATIREVVDRAAEEADAEVARLAVSVHGDCVRSFSARGVVGLTDGGGTVRNNHLDLATQRVTSMGIPFDRVILHCLPVEYVLDERPGLQNPLGMVGARLEMDAHLITGSQSAVSSTERAVDMAGYGASPIVFGPCATARYLISDEERRQGCLLIDIGGESTEYALFYRGRMRQSGTVPVGGNHVTRDIAYGLGLDPEQAERAKREHGVAIRSASIARPAVEADMDPGKIETLAAICEARQQELLELVANGLQWGISRPALAAGIFLTGGASRLSGSAELAEQVFALRATTRRAPGDDYAAEPDSWASVLGLVHHALEQEKEQAPASMTLGAPVPIWDNVRRWIGRLA